MVNESVTILEGDCIDSMRTLMPKSIQSVITSPPYYGLRDYAMDGQIGAEQTEEEYIEKMVEVFREVRRVLKDNGTVWLNLGDTYCDKQALMIPHKVAIALQKDGWLVRQDIVWHKPNPMPEGVKDRCTKAHEYIFLLAKNTKYHYDHESIKEKSRDTYFGRRGKTTKRHKTQSMMKDRAFNIDYTPDMLRNRHSVWSIPTRAYTGAHFAVFPMALIEPCVLAGCPEGEIILDPFGGSGTTALASIKHGRKAILCELNPKYIDIAQKRIGSFKAEVGLDTEEQEWL